MTPAMKLSASYLLSAPTLPFMAYQSGSENAGDKDVDGKDPYGISSWNLQEGALTEEQGGEAVGAPPHPGKLGSSRDTTLLLEGV